MKKFWNTARPYQTVRSDGEDWNHSVSKANRMSHERDFDCGSAGASNIGILEDWKIVIYIES